MEKFESPINNQKEESKKKSSWIGRNTRKLVGMTALTIASLSPHEGKTQNVDRLVTDSTVTSPTKEWVFVDKEKSTGTHLSSKYPGFVEYYSKKDPSNSNTEYVFAGYMNEDQLPVVPPEELQIQIVKKQIELSQYSDPVVWATKMFEYQKTDAFKQEVWTNKLADIKERIEDEKFALDVLKNSKDTSDSELSGETYSEAVARHTEELKANELSLKSLNDYPIHRENIIQEKTRTYEELVEFAKSNKLEIEESIQKLIQEKKEILEYISKHSIKK